MFVPQAKLLKILTIIEVLKVERLHPNEISKKFEISLRTCYRYLILIEEAGFIMDKDMDFKYFIFDMPPIVKERVKAILQLS